MPIRIKYDKTINISVASHRRDPTWKNIDILWSDLLYKFSQVHRTAETHAQYMKMKKDQQGEIKDVGGFVGGALVGGRRKKDRVASRSLITLDIDFPIGDAWDDYTLMYGNAAAIYSTHKHEPENPRLRLVIPLDREVQADEYQAISRKVAGFIGIDIFDTSTFQPERMMYWPSASQDSAFDFRYQDGPILSADEVLSSYRDWKDASQWPTAMRDFEQVNRDIKKQGDPLEKPGLVGAFCRTYSIHEAMEELLSDAYEQCSDENRYTYINGSTSAGVIVYEDKFAFSHHGTDPISGKLVNAFDLVRLNLFGLRDEDAKPGTPTVKLPSYLAMSDYAAADSKVRKTIGREKMQRAAEDFEVETTLHTINESGELEETISDDWIEKMDTDRKGNYKASIHNVRLILTHDPGLKNRFAVDEFSGRKNVLSDLPWRKVDSNSCYVVDSDEANLRAYIERKYDITSRPVISDAFEITIAANTFHPVRDYLNNLSWDGIYRLDKLLINYLGAEDSHYTRAVTRKTFVAAVARVMQPGIKFDYMLTLSGEEGKGKSTLIRKMAGQWFSDSFTTVEGTKAMEQIQGCWIVEAGEMKAMKRAEVQSVKHFISKQEDIFRPAYGHNTIYPKRQCIFIGTTNEDDPLKGENGDRRFWIVTCMHTSPSSDIRAKEAIAEDERAQLWAEAMYYYHQGEKLFLDDQLETVAKKHQKEHAEHDDRLGFITEYLSRKLPISWPTMSIIERRSWLHDPDPVEKGTVERDKFCVAEIWVEALDNKRETMNKYNTRDIHKLISRVEGWQLGGKIRFDSYYGTQKAFIKIIPEQIKTINDDTENFNS